MKFLGSIVSNGQFMFAHSKRIFPLPHHDPHNIIINLDIQILDNLTIKKGGEIFTDIFS